MPALYSFIISVFFTRVRISSRGGISIHVGWLSGAMAASLDALETETLIFTRGERQQENPM